jgi:hypothetical protein
MIPVSLLLILVAVTLLVLGLTGGSSSLLISSIGASLLAAVALVIGARQAAGARRSAEIPEPAEPEFAASYDSADPEFVAESPYGAEPEFVAESQFAESQFAESHVAASAGRGATDDFLAADDAFAGDSATSPQRDTVQFDPVGVDEQGDLSADAARVAGRRDAEAGMAAASTAHRPDPAAAAPEPDYDRAASAINAARSENPGENAWRRDAGGAAGFGEPDEFDEPDADDPDDEPLPQSVRPADAVRVARMDAEVLVVDGRPRYHVPECTHLVGRLTEPIPVNEAVELGFSPCGLCRPVDRLVSATSRR